ncbi:MAG: DUF1810 domain-containing protein [Erythrobacter sp.]|nr:DUF1810 domain-containing protein [Erythrobacter sp.]
MTPGADLDRFVQAQASAYPLALDELRAGLKQSHWMWFVFPQLAGLGVSNTARFFALAGRAEARAYLDHALLGPRLEECTRAMLSHAGRRSPLDVLGPIDAMKFRSSMTLFEAVSEPGNLFAQALDRLCDGVRDQLTLDLL